MPTQEEIEKVRQVMTITGIDPKTIEKVTMQMEKGQTQEELLTREEAAKLAKVNIITITRWIKKGRIKPVNRNGKKYLIRKADLIKEI